MELSVLGNAGDQETRRQTAYTLDPQKGFLPHSLRFAIRRCLKTNEKPLWRVEEIRAWTQSRLVGDVWMPTRIVQSTTIVLLVPNVIEVCRISVSRIKLARVKPADLFVPFHQGHASSPTLSKESPTRPTPKAMRPMSKTRRIGSTIRPRDGIKDESKKPIHWPAESPPPSGNGLSKNEKPNRNRLTRA